MPGRFYSRPGTDEIPRAADVVIIGGGPAGTAAAWAIAQRAPDTQTVVIESGVQLASGASNASLENFRTCWPTPCLAAMMRRSIDLFLNPAPHFGPEISRTALGVRWQGYVYCAFTEAGCDKFKAEVAHLHHIGLTHVEYLDAAEVAYRYPWLGPRVLGIKYDPMAGWLDSHALVHQFAANSGATRFLLDVEDVQIVVQAGRVCAVQTPYGRIDTPAVLIAAGANARRIGRTAGIEIPILVRPRQSFSTPWRHAEYPSDGPCVISAAPYPHVRPEARDGATFGWEYGWNAKTVRTNAQPGDPPDFLIDPIWPAERCKDPRFPSLTLAWLARQFGCVPGATFADARYLRGVDHRVGYYVFRDHTAAHHPESGPYESQRAIIDRWPDIGGLYLSVAHVGHGIMSSPAAGEIAAAHMLGLPLPDPLFADFGLRAAWVEHDSGGLSTK